MNNKSLPILPSIGKDSLLIIDLKLVGGFSAILALTVFVGWLGIS